MSCVESYTYLLNPNSKALSFTIAKAMDMMIYTLWGGNDFPINIYKCLFSYVNRFGNQILKFAKCLYVKSGSICKKTNAKLKKSF